MRTVWTGALAVVLVGAGVFAAERARAPQGREGGLDLMLLRQRSVQEDLKLSEQQAQKVQDFAARQFKQFQGLRDLSDTERRERVETLNRENRQFLSDTLKPEQVRRLRQIGLQVAGLMEIQDPRVSSELKLSAEQKEKLRDLQQEARKQFQEAMQSSENPRERQKQLDELRRSNQEKLVNLLTEEQKEKWKELTGEPFRGELRFEPPGENRPRD